jgi:hypothetical protein
VGEIIFFWCKLYFRRQIFSPIIPFSDWNTIKLVTDFRHLRWCTIDVNSVLELLHHSVVGYVADFSEVHALPPLGSALKTETICASKTPATSLITRRCNNTIIDLISQNQLLILMQKITISIVLYGKVNHAGIAQSV